MAGLGEVGLYLSFDVPADGDGTGLWNIVFFNPSLTYRIMETDRVSETTICNPSLKSLMSDAGLRNASILLIFEDPDEWYRADLRSPGF
jgi:hypothetical protein